MNKKINFLSFIFVSLISLVSAHEGEEFFGHHSMMFGTYGIGGVFFAWFFGLLIVIILVLLIILLIKQIQKN